jgi:catechol 2,3-dioxygenase-like lactoylglutathione lyase family enzyme
MLTPCLSLRLRRAPVHWRIKSMNPRISLLTLAVSNLERSLAFYRDGLGLPTKGIVGREFEHGAVAFFELSGGIKLALWAQDNVQHDTGIEKTPLCPTGFTIGHNVASRGEVDAVMAAAQRAGAKVAKAAQETFWGGYAGYFQDPDGHVWEIAWNPAMMPPEGAH